MQRYGIHMDLAGEQLDSINKEEQAFNIATQNGAPTSASSQTCFLRSK